jgi:hypothetical protein
MFPYNSLPNEIQPILMENILNWFQSWESKCPIKFLL